MKFSLPTLKSSALVVSFVIITARQARADSFLRGSLTSPSARSLWQDDRCRALDNLLECDDKHPSAAVCSIGGEKGCCPSDITGNVIMTHWDDGAEPCKPSAPISTEWQDDRCRALDNLECDDKHPTAVVCSIGGEKGCCPSDINGNVIMTHWDDGAEPCRLPPTPVPTASPTTTTSPSSSPSPFCYDHEGCEWVAEDLERCNDPVGSPPQFISDLCRVTCLPECRHSESEEDDQTFKYLNIDGHDCRWIREQLINPVYFDEVGMYSGSICMDMNHPNLEMCPPPTPCDYLDISDYCPSMYIGIPCK